jgi:hypothetical protein
MMFSLHCRWDLASLAHRESVLPGASGPADPTEGLTSPDGLYGKSWLHKGTRRRLGNQLGASPVKLVRTCVQIIGLPLGGRREDCLSPRDTRVVLLRVKPCLSGSESGMEVCIWVCVYESEMWLAMKRVQSPNLWVCGKLIWSRVIPNRTSILGIV